MKTTNSMMDAATTVELETIKAAAEAAQNWPLLWLCDGALAGDVGALATVRARVRAQTK